MSELQPSFLGDRTIDSIIDAAVNIDLNSTLGAVRATLGVVQPESIDLSMHNSLGVLTLSKERSPARLRNLLPSLMESALSLEQAVWSQADSEGDISSKGRFSQLITTFGHILYPSELTNLRHSHYSVKTEKYTFSPQDVLRHGKKIGNYDYQSPADIVAQVYERQSRLTLILDSFPFLSTDYGERFSYLNGTMPAFARQEMIGNCRDGRRFDEISYALEHAKKYEMRPHLLIGLSDENGQCLSVMRCDMAKKDKQLGLEVYSTAFPQIKIFVPLRNVPITESRTYLAELGRDFDALNIKPGYRLKACHGEADQINSGAFASIARAS